VHRCIAQGAVVPEERGGARRDSTALCTDPAALATLLAEDGYVFLRGRLERAAVEAARAEVFGRLAAVGEIAEPAQRGIATGHSRRRELVGDLGRFWQSVCEGPALRAIIGRVLGEAVRPHDYLFVRAAAVGRATGLHCDYPLFTRATERVVTAWLALGEVPGSDGPLMIVEGSHRFADLVVATRGFDVARDTGR